MGKPAKVAPASTMNRLPLTCLEESWIKYLNSIVNAGSDVPKLLRGAVRRTTFFSHSFCTSPCVISDLNSPGDIEFTRILYAPISNAITFKQISPHSSTNTNTITCKFEYYYYTFVIVLMAVFEQEYARPPGSWPRSRPAIDEMLITDPPCLASRIRIHTYLETNQVPVRFVLRVLSHSSSDKSKGECTLPTLHPSKLKDDHHNYFLLNHIN